MVDDQLEGKYPISVASRLTGVPEHKLRAFEAAGLFEPGRTEGGTRLYSDADLELVNRIAELVDKGVNYAGIHEILELTDQQTASEEVETEESE